VCMRETYTVRPKPVTVAKKALAIIKRHKPPGANLTKFTIDQAAERATATATSQEGILHNSEIRVEMRPGYDGSGSVVEVSANDEKTANLLAKLRRGLK